MSKIQKRLYVNILKPFVSPVKVFEISGEKDSLLLIGFEIFFKKNDLFVRLKTAFI